jgi:16S rRNA (uracil1498-N3)-methyltransferase
MLRGRIAASLPMNLILCEPGEIGADGVVTLTGPRAAHIRDVLRVGRGDRVRLGVVDGAKGEGEVLSLDDGQATLRAAFHSDIPPAPGIDLLLAVPRPKVLRRLWAQIAALGVGRIFLSNAWRVERHYFDAHVLGPSIYRPLLIEGLQQAGDTRLPRVSIHRQFRVLIGDELGPSAGERRIVAHPGSEGSLLTPPRDSGQGRVLLAIGPEGGWNTFELELLARHGFVAVGLGARTLRTDTACVALLAVLNEARRADRLSSDGAR